MSNREKVLSLGGRLRLTTMSKGELVGIVVFPLMATSV